MEQHPPSLLTVTPEEAGGKLIRFLERRLEGGFPPAMFHKWIRTGQVRVNGKRAKPFFPLAAGDQVRLPPFALPRSFAGESAPSSPCGEGSLAADTSSFPPGGAFGISPCPQPVCAACGAASPPFLGTDVSVVAMTADMLVAAKPAGLAVQGGSALTDSLALRLAKAYAHQPFTPAPVHRLDRATSGLVVIGTTHAGLQRLSALFAAPQGLHKEYLAVVRGHWPHGPSLLSDTMEKGQERGFERMAVVRAGGMLTVAPEAAQGLFQVCGQGLCPVGGAGAATHQGGDGLASHPQKQAPDAAIHSHGEEAGAFARRGEEGEDARSPEFPLPELSPGCNAHCVVVCLRHGAVRPPKGEAIPASLLRVRLLTGKKHQIRVQLAHRGFPIIGDTRYNGPSFPQLLLHAAALRFPDGFTCTAGPAWAGVEALFASQVLFA